MYKRQVYLLSGMLGTVLACLLTGVTGSTYCLSLSLLLAFAMLYPEVQLSLIHILIVGHFHSDHVIIHDLVDGSMRL